jgi:arabinogalactan endo-1,4-beta-galactosidase
VWKDTFPNRTDFIAGGIVIDSLWQRTWENKWKEVDPIQVLRENGVEWVRVLVDITKSQELSDTPPEQWSTLDAKYDEYYYSREYVEQIMREAQNLGFHLYLMYSLTTAQGKPCYDAPEVWKDLNATELAAAVEEYTYDTTKYYQSKGLNIEIYEISGENENGFLGFYPGGKIPIPEGVDSGTDMDFMRNYVWNIGADLLKSAIKGVRRADTDAKIVIHATGFGYGWSKDEVLVKSFFQAMIDEGVDFDYAGLTHPYAYFDPPFSDYWYPNQFSKIAWFQHMKDTISHIAGLGKKVIFSEAGYPPSSDSIYCDPMPDYPFTPEGQAAWLHDELLFATNNEDVVGFFYYLADSYEDYFRLFASETQPQPAMKEFLMGRTPAAFELSRLTINPTQAEINSPITVSTEIKNTGGISGFYDAALKLNGIVEESKRVLLNSDTQTTVNFNVTKAIAGSYSVEVGSLSGSFIVRAPPRPAAINLKSLVISKALVKSGEEVTVNATLENIGEQSGTYALVFNLDGVQKDSSTVSLDGGKTVTKTIKFSSNVEGTHTVTVGGESVTFDVEKVQMGIPGYPIESVLIGVILVIIILTLYSRKRASRNPGKPSLSLASKVLGEKHSLFID